VDGVNLAQLMKNGRIAPREALAIVPQICDALQFAHDHGIVHRDIKPENLLLDRLGRVKVADFGIAKVVASVCDDPMRTGEIPVPTDATIAGKIIGTPQYMAPEQIERPSAVDHRADIYALGVVFYQMLTGELPGKDLKAPSRKAAIDVRLDEMVLRALESQPERRYQTALEFRTVLDGLPAATPPPQVPKRGMMRRWWWMFFVMIPLGTLLGLVAAAVVTYVMPKRYETQATVEVKAPEGSTVTPAFFGNQFEAMKSRALLKDVSQELELPNKWMTDEETVIRILKGIVSAQNLRDTDLITLKVRHTNREEAADIANAVLRRYQRIFGGQVIVHETPQPPNVPVSPNVPLNLTLGSVGGFVLSPLMTLLLIPLMQKVFPENRKEEPRAKRSSAVVVVSIILVLLLVGVLLLAFLGSLFLWNMKAQRAVVSGRQQAMERLEETKASASADRFAILEMMDSGEIRLDGRVVALESLERLLRDLVQKNADVKLMLKRPSGPGATAKLRVLLEICVRAGVANLEVMRNSVPEPGLRTLTIRLLSNGGQTLNGEEISHSELADALEKQMKIPGASEILISGENKVPYQRFLDVIDLCQRIGFWNLSVSSEARGLKDHAAADQPVPTPGMVDGSHEPAAAPRVAETPKNLGSLAETTDPDSDFSTIRLWLEMLDEEKYDESYQALAPVAADQASVAQWKTSIESARKPLGKALSRTFRVAEALKTIPGVPGGEGRVCQFSTEFEHQKEAIESIILIKVGNDWKPAGYFIK
jgi:capsular polysaccharide biosynthesis protein/biopolymer transport protein ExbD